MNVDCLHPKTMTSDMSAHGINAEVTICSACGVTVDTRALREIDTGGNDEPPISEAEIQAYAKKAKAEEIREESGETEALPLVTLKSNPSEEEVKASLESKAALAAARVPHTEAIFHAASCSKHGGEIPECDSGPGKAHHCVNGKWGKRGTFNGPCQCLCHAWSNKP